ncbi:MAG: FeoB-associated Cys-rich membrane protein [Blastocatellia bacterium]|nr:FeoB-associated Cys-rich membrane protein [Blastocatellia bacterium]
MDFQTIIVAIIIIIALLYVGKIVFLKIKSFSAKSNCGNDCSCSSKANSS